MSKPSSGYFTGTIGASNGKQLELDTYLVDSNLSSVTERYPITKTGYFGTKGKNVRVISSRDPVLTSQDFYSRISKNAVIHVLPNGKGTKAVFADGTTITHRVITSTPGSPAVDINIKSPGIIKKQKIHFIKGE